jgi:hypothetical protein
MMAISSLPLKGFFKYAEERFNALTQCAIDKKCVQPLTWTPQKCPATLKIPTAIRAFPVKTLSDNGGEMVVLRGSHPVYDCLPCQRLSFTYQPGDDSVQTRWSTAIDGVVRGANYTLRQETETRIWTKYRYISFVRI